MLGGFGAKIVSTLQRWAKGTPLPDAAPQGYRDLTALGGSTLDFYKSLVPPSVLSSARELVLAQMDGSTVLQTICNRVDRELLSFLDNPRRFIDELKRRIETESLAARFKVQLTPQDYQMVNNPAYGALGLVVAPYDRAALARDGEVYLKRRGLLNELDALTRSVQVDYPFGDSSGQIRSPAQAAAPRMRALLLDFAFAQNDFA